MDVSALQVTTVERVAAQFMEGGWQNRSDEDNPRFRLQVTDDIAIYVGLGPEEYANGIAFAPNLGVQHADTSRLFAEFRGLSPNAGKDLCSAGFSLADVFRGKGISNPVARRWRISSLGEASQLAELIYRDIVEFGTSEFSDINSLDGLIDYIQARQRFQVMSGHLAVACALAGRRDEAEDALREYSDSMPSQKGAMLIKSQEFISNFSRYFGFGASFLSSSRG